VLRYKRLIEHTGTAVHNPETHGFMNPAEFANIAQSEKDFWWYRGMRAIFFRMVEPYLAGRKIVRALEAGCGTGYFAHLLQTEHRWPLVPADVGWEGLQLARAMGVQRPIQTNVLELPFSAGAFDLVLSMDVLPHLQRGEDQQGISEMGRVLAPGGLLVIRTAALDILRSRHSEFVYERQRFTKGRLVDMVERAGVRVRRCTYANSLLMPIALAKFRIWEPLTRQAPSSGVGHVAPWLDRLLYGALAAERAWLGTGLNLPIGQSLILIGEKA
jgi:SAM-dependent methyltransferase